MSGSTKKRKGEFSSESQTEAKAAFDPATIPPSRHKTHEIHPVVVREPGVVVGDAKAKPAGADADGPQVDDADAVSLPGGLPSNRLQVVETDAQLARAFAEQLEASAKGGKAGKIEAPATGAGRDFPTGPRLGKAAGLPELQGEIVDADSAEAGVSSWEADTAPEPALARGAGAAALSEAWKASDEPPPSPSPAAAPVAPIESTPSPAAVAPVAGADAPTSAAPAGHPHAIARAVTFAALAGIVILGAIALFSGGGGSNPDGARRGAESTAGDEPSPAAARNGALNPPSATSPAATAKPATSAESSAASTATSAKPTTSPPPTAAPPPSKAAPPPPTTKPAPPTSPTTKPEVF